MISKCSILVIVLYFYSCSFVKGHSSTKGVTPKYMESLLKSNKLQEFANILQIDNVDLVDPSQQKTSLEELYFYNSLEYADILLRPGQLLNPGDDMDFNGTIKFSINKWKNGTVPYYITNTFLQNQTDFIKSQIRYVNKVLKPNVYFRKYRDGDTDYVLFFNGGCGCYSNLGNVGGPQAISLVDPCFKTGFIAHEMQHTIGFAHEHNRIDRDDYLHIVPENIPEAIKSQYEKYSPENMLNTGPFDYYSIMMYPVTVPGFKKLTALDLLQDGIDTSRLGAEKYLSPTDIQRVKTLYS